MKKYLFVSVITLLIFLISIEIIGLKHAVAETIHAPGNRDEQITVDLAELSIEELMEITVSIGSKKDQKLSKTASAVYVITQEDIRRSGHKSIPELLRLVPGLQVTHIDANKWAISSRGFNQIFSNKLLVMIDGRNVYTPAFAGVYWDVQDTLLEDIEQIEVIRGPGATIWGANAVNGVINIITKNAKDTRGGLVTAGGGDEENGFGAIRYGEKIGEDAYARVYTKYFTRDGFNGASDVRENDDWDAIRGGFRVDWDTSSENLLTFQGDIYNGHVDTQYTSVATAPPLTSDESAEISGGNVLTRWKHTISDTSEIITQFYYDHTKRFGFDTRQVLSTYDIDFFHRFELYSQQEIMWGLGYRFINDRMKEANTILDFDNERRSNNLFSAFVQDQITIAPNRLKLTFGSKFEQNDFTGFEVQPSARLLWTPNDKHAAWAAVSRAIRSSSRLENALQVNVVASEEPSVLIQTNKNRDFKSENLLAYEIGYRVSPIDRLSLDFAAYYNIYDDLLTVEPGDPIVDLDSPQQLTLPSEIDNNMDGETYGVEIAVNYQATDYLKLFAGYTYLQMELHSGSSSIDYFSVVGESANSSEGNSPHHQFQLRSYLNLPHNLEFDTSLYYVDSLPNQDVDSYFRLDSRIGWSPGENLDVSLVFQNLLDPEHQEFGSELGNEATEVERSVYGQITWRW